MGRQARVLPEHRILGRLKDAIESAQDHDRQHDKAVLGRPIWATEPVAVSMNIGPLVLTNIGPPSGV
jgi:hypothetical protein